MFEILRGRCVKVDTLKSILFLCLALTRGKALTNYIPFPWTQIVWDDDKKQWIDTTKSEEEQAVINAPPPKDSELPTGTPPATPLQPATGPPSAGTPTNKFSRQGTFEKGDSIRR